MNTSLEKLSVPLVLMGSLWAAVGIVFDAFVVINSRRDLILTLITECGKCEDHALTPKLIYWTNLLPLSIGLILFLIVVMTLIISLPSFISFEDENFARKLKIISILFTMPLAFTILSFLASATFDFYYILQEDI